MEFDEGDTIPERIFLDYLVFRVRNYIPNPMRCFKCQNYGHTQVYCNKFMQICSICSDQHSSDNCPNKENPKCPNCGESHNAGYKKCIKYQEVRNVLKIATDKKLSYKEALLWNQNLQAGKNETERNEALSHNHQWETSEERTSAIPTNQIQPRINTHEVGLKTIAGVKWITSEK